MNFAFKVAADTTDEALRATVEHLDALVLKHPLFDRQKAAVLAVVEAAIYKADDPNIEESMVVKAEGTLAATESGASFSIQVDVSVQS